MNVTCIRIYVKNEPNQTAVSVVGGLDFYMDRGPSVVRLHRRNNAMSPTAGVFCCEVPDAVSLVVQVCINTAPVRGMLSSYETKPANFISFLVFGR